jgi:hypothetical protein
VRKALKSLDAFQNGNTKTQDRRESGNSSTQKWSMSNEGFVKGQLGCNRGQEVKNKWKMGICVIVIDHGEEVLAMLIAPKTT